MTKPSCAGCLFFHPGITNSTPFAHTSFDAGGVGECRCNHPVMASADGTSYGQGIWPGVYADSWCGSFTVRDEGQP